MYAANDELMFQVKGITLTYRVSNSYGNEWFLTNMDVYNFNNAIFDKLHITDRETFVVDASGCMLAHHHGSFPVIRCDDESGINRVIDALQQKCAEMSGQPDALNKPVLIPLYKKGDVVTIISKYTIHDRSRYRFYFASQMDQYCNHSYIIDDVLTDDASVDESDLIPDDRRLYRLKDANGKILPYNFSSSMFESKLVLPQIADKPIQRPDATVCTETKINTNMYKNGDKVTFYIGNDDLTYTVICDNNDWWLGNCDGSNLEIFRKLEIRNRFAFVRKISQHMCIDTDVDFPEVHCNDETEINKVIDALLKECDEYNRHNRREIPYIPEQCKTLEYKIKLGKPKKYQLKFTN